MSDRETFKLTFEERAKAEQEYGRACDEPEEVAFELVALRSRIDMALGYLGDECACDSDTEGEVNGLCDFCEIRLALKGEK